MSHVLVVIGLIFKNKKRGPYPEAQTTHVDTTYQVLDLSKMNKEDNYQSLRVTAANNDAVNDDESTYSELNKVRDVENNYQSLTHLTWDFLAGSIPTACMVKKYFSLPGVDTLRITLAKQIKYVIEFKTTTSMWNILYLRMKWPGG